MSALPPSPSERTGNRLEETVASVTVPVRVVMGEHDTLSELPWQRSLSRPAAPPVVMGGLPHSAMHAAPDRFARLMTIGYGRSSSGDSSGAGSRDSFGPPPESTVEASGPSWSSSSLSSDSGFSPA